MLLMKCFGDNCGRLDNRALLWECRSLFVFSMMLVPPSPPLVWTHTACNLFGRKCELCMQNLIWVIFQGVTMRLLVPNVLLVVARVLL